jgi:hypothetical protein
VSAKRPPPESRRHDPMSRAHAQDTSHVLTRTLLLSFAMLSLHCSCAHALYIPVRSTLLTFTHVVHSTLRSLRSLHSLAPLILNFIRSALSTPRVFHSLYISLTLFIQHCTCAHARVHFTRSALSTSFIAFITASPQRVPIAHAFHIYIGAFPNFYFE